MTPNPHPAASENGDVIEQHLAWLKIYAEEMNENNWKDTRHRIICQLGRMGSDNAKLSEGSIVTLRARIEYLTHEITARGGSLDEEDGHVEWGSSGDWWKPNPDDPFWMLEAEDGEWLMNEHSFLGTRDATKAIRFPTEKSANAHPARMTPGYKWWTARATEHKWIEKKAEGSGDGKVDFENLKSTIDAASKDVANWPQWKRNGSTASAPSPIDAAGMRLVYDKDKRTIVAVSESGKRFSLVAEGSGDGKMRSVEEMQEFTDLRDLAQATSTPWASLCLSFGEFGEKVFCAADREKIVRAIEALATPAPSPIDAAGMREVLSEIHGDLSELLASFPPNAGQEEKINSMKEKVWAAFRALPTPARVDRERIAKIICNSHPRNDCVQDEEGRDPCTLENCRYMKTADAIISAIGGRHV